MMFPTCLHDKFVCLHAELNTDMSKDIVRLITILVHSLHFVTINKLMYWVYCSCSTQFWWYTIQSQRLQSKLLKSYAAMVLQVMLTCINYSVSLLLTHLLSLILQVITVGLYPASLGFATLFWIWLKTNALYRLYIEKPKAPFSCVRNWSTSRVYIPLIKNERGDICRDRAKAAGRFSEYLFCFLIITGWSTNDL